LAGKFINFLTADQRKKVEEALATYKQENERLNEQFENEARSKEKVVKNQSKLQADIEELTVKLEGEKKKREAAEKKKKVLTDNLVFLLIS
jgi:predicted  nucleic acid-binding Zn-ribbon protein